VAGGEDGAATVAAWAAATWAVAATVVAATVATTKPYYALITKALISVTMQATILSLLHYSSFIEVLLVPCCSI